METQEFKKLVVAFQIGTLSKYNYKNPNVITYLGEMDFKAIQKLRINEIFYKKVDGKDIITDEMGNIVSDDDINGEVGVLNFDNNYDTTYCKYYEDCTIEEMEVIKKSDMYKTAELEAYLGNINFNK